MLQQIPNAPLYDKNPTGGPQFRNWTDLLCAFNDQLTQGPVWLYNTPGQQGLIGFPFNALLNWSMSTPAGLLAFHRPDVNAHLREILTAYGTFLSSPASAAVLNSNATGWLSPTALDALVSTACLPTIHTTSNSSDRESKTNTSDDPRPQFHDLFVSDPLHPTYGFSSWDAFFTRRFRPGIRPIASPSDDGVIVNACESTPVALERGVRLHDEFWVKGQPYSLMTILGALQTNAEEESGDDLDKKRDEKEKNEREQEKEKELEQAMRFEGGTIYQGFLGALSYHRWHASVSGVAEKVRKIQGTYFAGCPGLASRKDLHDGEERKLDPSAPDRSQRYLCQVGTRALVYIRARDRRLGTVVFVAVGMAEVSSCEVTVREGDVVEKGEEMGMFHYGGSTHCLIFEPGVRLKFRDAVEEVEGKRRGHNLPVNGYLAELLSE
uniref:Related to phosphatidylserine decarboxylase 2 n=1 Tax=Neurospora crassa TaxID=5141 RepID=Q872Y6_NEUCS|nr:related to phosphatidylserine decarboxylase 2 [Neurospora crassa]